MKDKMLQLRSTLRRRVKRIRLYFRPFLIGVIASFSVCLALFAKVYVKHVEHVSLLRATVSTLASNDKKIDNMAMAMQVAYSFSKYEARLYALAIDACVSWCNERYKTCVPWELLAVTYQNESRYKSYLTSPKNAKGVGQMLPGTFSERMKALGIRYDDCDIWNYSLNMVGSSDYISMLYADKGLEYAIRSYFGGPAHKKTDDVLAYNSQAMIDYNRLVYIYKGIQCTER